jgi:hypothetical protein
LQIDFFLREPGRIYFHHGIDLLGGTEGGRKKQRKNKNVQKIPVHMVKIRANLCYLAFIIKQNFS